MRSAVLISRSCQFLVGTSRSAIQQSSGFFYAVAGEMLKQEFTNDEIGKVAALTSVCVYRVAKKPWRFLYARTASIYYIHDTSASHSSAPCRIRIGNTARTARFGCRKTGW